MVRFHKAENGVHLSLLKIIRFNCDTRLVVDSKRNWNLKKAIKKQPLFNPKIPIKLF